MARLVEERPDGLLTRLAGERPDRFVIRSFEGQADGLWPGRSRSGLTGFRLGRLMNGPMGL
ncbi:hypothetical protein AVL59_37190 [Streptomyces griseochromogenes]|uniref:Uncharacterized protein n=1 Tax=Streptomyces griseochromogenes TaxID=68214 RepID=A0A1B1B6U5_9ACTN|nr:hypothetical protein AVL59_37190 [Streptomyces griseochromogenes]